MNYNDYFDSQDAEFERQLALTAQKRWELDLAKLQEMGAPNRATAIRWDADAENATNGGVFDAGYYCYLRGIDYALVPSIVAELVAGDQWT